MNAEDRRTQKSSSRVVLHPAERAIVAAAAAGSESAQAYLRRLQEHDRYGRTLVRHLRAVRDRDVRPAEVVDSWTRDEIELAAIEAIQRVDNDPNATDADRARAIEAARIILRAELVCSRESTGRYGSRETAGRRAVHARAAYQVDGRLLQVEHAREVPERVRQSPATLAGRMGACAVAWTVGRSANEPWTAPLGCACALCPRCLHARGGARVRRALPVLLALVRAGYQPVHVTLTQRRCSAAKNPVILTDYERPNYLTALRIGGGREARQRGRAVPGTSLGQALATLVNAWSTITNSDRRCREWWRSTVAAGLTGTEWTSRSPRPAGWWPAWHVHRHAVLLLRPDVELDTWRQQLIAEWCARVDAVPAAQLVQRIAETDTGLAGGLVETLKYPFKPAECTVAQTCEIVAATAGLHLHQATGAWHGSSRIAKAAKSRDFTGLTDADAHLARALAAGHDAAELAETDTVCLYRRVGLHERADRRTVLPLDDPWSDDIPAGVAPITVAYLRDRLSAGIVTGDILEYRPKTRAWTDAPATSFHELLAAAETYEPGDA